jgi:hypothetical protein
MHEPDTEAINAATKPEIGYEYRDISLRPIIFSTVWFFLGTGVTIFLTLVGLWALVDLPLRSTNPPGTIPAAPNPLVQSNMATKADMFRLRREEDAKVNKYGWVDREKGVARIPVDKAIDLMAERGLQATPTSGGSGMGDGL